MKPAIDQRLPHCPKCGCSLEVRVVGMWEDPVWEPGRTEPFIGGPVFESKCEKCGGAWRAYGERCSALNSLDWSPLEKPA